MATRRMHPKTKHTITKKKCRFDFKKITPQTLLKLFGKRGVAVVNTLSNTVHINTSPMVLSCCHGMDFSKKPAATIKKHRLIVLYCANYTCTASHNYAKKLVTAHPDLQDRIVLYEGGTNEWALLNMTFPDVFTFYDSERKMTFTPNMVEEEFFKMGHRNESTKGSHYQKMIMDNQQPAGFYRSIFRKKDVLHERDLMKGKVCVVTGGTSGLGLEVVHKLLTSGAKHVTLTYYHNTKRAKRIEKMLANQYDQHRFYVLRADARTKEGNKLTFNRELRRKRLGIDVGPIDCVDINAGIFGPANMHKKHIHNIKESDYDKTIATNLTGYFLAMKYFSKQAIEHDVQNGSIVCIKSIYGSSGSLFSNTAYQTSKHGVMGLVHQSAVELSRANKELKIRHPIRVNAVSPTFTDTALTRPFLNEEKIDKTLKQSNTMGRLAYKRDVAEAVLFLLSDKATSITGIDLPVDCGVLAESIPTYEEVKSLNSSGIKELSCCGDKL